MFKAAQKKLIDPSYLDKNWRETNVPEMKAYFGLNILFGAIPLHRVRHYWSKNPYLGNDGVKNVMPVRRFEKLTSYLHISGRNMEIGKGNDGYDKLAKVRPVIKSLLMSFPKYMHPSKCQAIDEGMIAFKGRVSYLQYNKAKPIKRGIKAFLRCESRTGYLYQFEIYLGKAEQKPTVTGVYFDVITRLTRSLIFNNHHIFFDNLYTSVPLSQYLLDNGIYSCGTLRANRKYMPSDVRKPCRKLTRGELIMYQDLTTPNMTVCAWQDTKLVRFLSTLSQPDIVVNTPRRVGRNYMNVPIPSSGSQYNLHMAGCDIADSLRRQYRSGRFSKKVWKYLLWFLVDVAGVNAWLLYQKATKRKLTNKNYDHIDFVLELGTELVGGYTSRIRTASGKIFVGNVNNLNSHENVHLGPKRARRCYHHGTFMPNGKKIYQTVFGCEICNVNLCKMCHADFHK